MIAIDGGAHIGYIALHIGQIVGPQGKVYAFEPDPRAYARLVAGIALNRMAEIVEPLNFALASSPSLPPSEREYDSKPLLERSQLMPGCMTYGLR